MQDKKCRITLYSHGALFSHMTPMTKAILWDYISKNRSFKFEYNPKTKRNVRVVGEEYYFIPEDRRHVAVHRNQLAEILKLLDQSNIKAKHIEYVYCDTYKGADVEIIIKDGKDPRDYQVPIVAHVVTTVQNPTHGTPTACLPVQTGRGKTLMALFAAREIGKRIGVLCASAYLEKWDKDLGDNLEGVNSKTVIKISGCTQLIAAFNRERDYTSKGKSTGVIAYIVSLETLNSFVKRFILHRERFDGDPHELFQTLGLGFVIKDEVHQLFHQLFKTEVYMHQPAVIALSATIEDKRDRFKEQMYHVIWPKASRYDKLEKIRYTDVLAYQYSMSGIQPYSYTQRGSYSHNQLEKSIMSNKSAKDCYLDMVGNILDTEHIEKMKTGERCLVYASMNDTVEAVSSYLTDRYPDLTIGEYIRQDPLENILTSDITVTSPAKATAALDVPNLSTVLNLVNGGSQKRIVQTAGRLRELEDSSTRYVYTYSPDVPKHLEYAKFTNECLGEVVKTINAAPMKYSVRFVKNADYKKAA